MAARASCRRPTARTSTPSTPPCCRRSSRPMEVGAGSVLADDGADDLARLHRGEGLVHLVELDAARDHRADVEAAGLDQLDEAREVAAHLGRAVEAALEVLL